jgi:hypothetical protein
VLHGNFMPPHSNVILDQEIRLLRIAHLPQTF